MKINKDKRNDKMNNDNPDRHFYLYAKYHYLKKDIKEDLKRLVQNRCGGIFKISNRDLILVMLTITKNHVENKEQFEVFMLGMLTRFDEKDTGLIAFLKQCLYRLAWLDIKEIPFDLGKPDENILPLSNNI